MVCKYFLPFCRLPLHLLPDSFACNLWKQPKYVSMDDKENNKNTKLIDTENRSVFVRDWWGGGRWRANE